MGNRKYIIVGLCLVLALAFSGCGSKDGDKEASYGPLLTQAKEAGLHVGNLTTGVKGDTLSNSFFDWTISEVRTEKEIYGKTAKDGKKFVIVDVSVTNTTDEEYEIGNYDFVAYVAPDMESGLVDTMDSFNDSMYPDEEMLAAGKTRTGELIFEVDESVEELIVDYIEFFGDEEMGNTNWFDLFV
ncbi:DUF4352 domain-containing protein [Anaerovoracaceae bacterium 42-11]